MESRGLKNIVTKLFKLAKAQDYRSVPHETNQHRKTMLVTHQSKEPELHVVCADQLTAPVFLSTHTAKFFHSVIFSFRDPLSHMPLTSERFQCWWESLMVELSTPDGRGNVLFLF